MLLVYKERKKMCRLLLIIISLFLFGIPSKAEVVTTQKEEPIEAFDMDTPAKPYNASEEVYDMEVPQKPNKKILKRAVQSGVSFGQIMQVKKEDVTQNEKIKEIKLKNIPKPTTVTANKKGEKISP